MRVEPMGPQTLVVTVSAEDDGGMRKTPFIRRGAAIATGVLLVVGTACGTSDEQTVRSGAETPAQADTTSTTEAPLEPCEFRCAEDGAEYAVVGIAFDDGLPLRSSPDVDGTIVATLSSTATVTATGTNTVSWAEVSADGSTGWAPRPSIAPLANETDATDRIVAAIGSNPIAASMVELGRIVADSQTESFDDITSSVTLVVRPSEARPAEVTYDVIGFPDDSVQGSRLVVVGREVDDDSLPATGFRRAVVWELESVTSTDICARGAGIDLTGLCV